MSAKHPFLAFLTMLAVQLSLSVAFVYFAGMRRDVIGISAVAIASGFISFFICMAFGFVEIED